MWGAAARCGLCPGVSQLEVRVCVYLDCQALFVSGGQPGEDSDFVSLGVWLVGPLCIGGIPIVKRARCRDLVCGAAVLICVSYYKGLYFKRRM